MSFKEFTINSISEFVHLFEGLSNNDNKVLLFRGQNIDKPLIPKIARYRYKKSRIITEKRMFNEFELSSLPFLDKVKYSKLELLTIAQHYGVPTRLLDWTENLLTALFFAVREYEINTEINSVVWAMQADRESEIFLEDYEINPFELNQTIKLFKPSNVITRISSQSGWFSIHPHSGSSFFERFETNKFDDVKLIKILIKKEDCQKILVNLERCGIDIHTVFRDLDSLGSLIRNKNIKK